MRSRSLKVIKERISVKRSNFLVMAKLIKLVKPLTGYMLMAIFMGLIGHLCAAFITIFGVFAVLKVLGVQVFTGISVKMIFVSVCIFALLRGILRYAEQASNHYIAFKLLALIRDKVFAALRRLCPAKLDGKDKGDLISVITSDIELLEVFYAHTISPTVIAVLFSIIMVLFIGSYSLLAGLTALAAYITVGGIMPTLASKLSSDTGIKFRTKSGEFSGFMLDSLRGLSELIQFGAGSKQLAEMNKKTAELVSVEEKMKAVTGTNNAMTNTVILLFDIVMLFVCSLFYINGSAGIESVFIPVTALMSSFGPTVALANLGTTLQNTFAAGNRVLDILEEEPLISDVTDGVNVDFENAGAENVSFSYKKDGNSEVVLKNVSLDISKNSIIGIVGKSGCGKSTLLKLFMRFYETASGRISISHVNVNDINTSGLRDIESFVTQDTYLFHDSIANNLRVAKPDATVEEMIQACKKASVHEFIMKLPNGYDTQVGELGDTLSGGERQRIGLARAFLHNAPFMLLDEPTSNLDSLNEAVILKSLSDERDGKTIVIVSHRESTMRIADKVCSVQSLARSS